METSQWKICVPFTEFPFLLFLSPVQDLSRSFKRPGVPRLPRMELVANGTRSSQTEIPNGNFPKFFVNGKRPILRAVKPNSGVFSAIEYWPLHLARKFCETEAFKLAINGMRILPRSFFYYGLQHARKQIHWWKAGQVNLSFRGRMCIHSILRHFLNEWWSENAKQRLAITRSYISVSGTIPTSY